MYRFISILFFAYLINVYPNSTSLRYVALGDSLAVGVGAFWNRGYTRLYYNWLANCLNLQYLCYCNLGVMRWTSADLFNAVTTNGNYRNSIKAASIITLNIGGNDILRQKQSPYNLPQALETYRNNLYATLYEIRSLNQHAQIYLMDIYNPYPLGHELHEICELWVTHYNSVIWNTLLHAELGITGIAKVYDAFKGNECQYTLIRYDNIHPNSLGYNIINQCFQAVTTELNAND